LSSVPRDQVAAVVELLALTLGSSLLGVYLYGSAVDGGLRRDSDLDLLGVVDKRLTDTKRRAIVDRLLSLSGRATRPKSWRPVELTLLVRDEIRPWRYPPRFDLQYGEWLRAEFLSGNLEPWPPANPDVAVLVSMVLERGEAVVGPPARDLLAVVPREDVLRSMADGLSRLLDDLDDDTRNVLLTLARMWLTATTGDVRSKDFAAEWAASRLSAGSRSLMLRARAGYLGEVDDRWDDRDEARRLADGLRSRILARMPPLPPADASV
jgi:predicted nucleotidyltransferase